MTMVCLAWNEIFFVIFVCTDVRKCLSETKFDAEADFDVRLAVAPPKPHQNDGKMISETKNNRIFSESFFRIVFSMFSGVAKGRRRLEL